MMSGDVVRDRDEDSGLWSVGQQVNNTGFLHRPCIRFSTYKGGTDQQGEDNCQTPF